MDKIQSKILIIDDDETIHKLFSIILDKDDFELHFSNNGKDGYEIATELVPDLVISDVNMPRMSGYEVCQKLRNNNQLSQIPIVLITTMDDYESKMKGIKAGADDFVYKPFDFNELRGRINNITKLNRYRKLLNERSRFQWVVDKAPNGYIILDYLDQVTYANSVAKLYLGINPEKTDLQRLNFTEAIKKLYNSEPEDALPISKINISENSEYNFLLIRPESENEHAFWLKATVFRQNSDEDSFLLQLKDVTQEINSQREMRTFHSLIAHKLRTPIGSAIGSIDILDHYGKELTKEEISELVNSAKESLKRLHNEIEDILYYLNNTINMQSDDRFDLNNFTKLITDLEYDLKIKTISIDTEEDLSHSILKISSSAFEWILLELFQNAKKFHPKKDPIIDIVLRESDKEHFVIKVIDDGRHLSPKTLSNVWQPYYQGEKHFTGEIEGMGLGLASVASMILETGGEFSIYNREDKPGIIVELSIPYLEFE